MNQPCSFKRTCRALLMFSALANDRSAKDLGNRTTMPAMKKLLGKMMLGLIWAICGVTHAGTVTYYYTDPQGTPLAQTDASGNITATFEYTPYGTYAPQGTSTPGQNPNGPGFTGHVNDPETNLVYMQARYYDSVLGRLLSVDPVGPSASNIFSFNRYAYASNNPVINIDPDGRQSEDADEIETRQAETDALNPWLGPNTITASPFVRMPGESSDSFAARQQAVFSRMCSATGQEPVRPYSNLNDPSSVGEGKDFTRAQKANIYRQNMAKNNGVLRSDLDGQELVAPQRSRSGVTPPPNEAQIDHMDPKNPSNPSASRGSNSYRNARVLSRQQNRAKSNSPAQPPPPPIPPNG